MQREVVSQLLYLRRLLGMRRGPKLLDGGISFPTRERSVFGSTRCVCENAMSDPMPMMATTIT